MKKIILCVAFSLSILSVVGWGSLSGYVYPNRNWMDTSSWITQQTKIICAQANNIDPYVLGLGLKAYTKARQQGLDAKQLLTIVDYHQPSFTPRLWVLDLKNGKVLFNTLVSHGKNSGGIYASSFSNARGSLASSLGVYLTKNPYFGGEGLSLRLVGLEKGFNDNAYVRDIVVHGASYVGSEVAKKYGQVGRSWGWLAINRTLAKTLIDTIKENTLIFVYYPDQRYLRTSAYLT